MVKCHDQTVVKCPFCQAGMLPELSPVLQDSVVHWLW
jgi:hypothetical protein